MSPKDYEIRNREIHMGLAKLAQASFANRRSYEWKVAFGFWSAIGLWTYFICDKIEKMPNTDYLLGCIFVCYMFILVIWVITWEVPIRRAFQQDNEAKHYYIAMAEGKDCYRAFTGKYAKEILPVESLDVVRLGSGVWKPYQTFISFCFLLLSFICIYYIVPPKPAVKYTLILEQEIPKLDLRILVQKVSTSQPAK